MLVATAERTLELSNPDGHDIRNWIDGFKLLIRVSSFPPSLQQRSTVLFEIEDVHRIHIHADFHLLLVVVVLLFDHRLPQYQKHFQKKIKEVTSSTYFKSNFAEVSRTQLGILERGIRVKKWPAQKRFYQTVARRTNERWLVNRKPMLRRLQLDSRVSRLVWRDLSSGKDKGFLLLKDLLEVHHDPDNGNRFALRSKGRTLELEFHSDPGPGNPDLDDVISAINFVIMFKTHLGIKED